ncbi:MAG: hypothetical protein AABX30_02655 [Nanoarchaeota archaeon]
MNDKRVYQIGDKYFRVNVSMAVDCHCNLKYLYSGGKVPGCKGLLKKVDIFIGKQYEKGKGIIFDDSFWESYPSMSVLINGDSGETSCFYLGDDENMRIARLKGYDLCLIKKLKEQGVKVKEKLLSKGEKHVPKEHVNWNINYNDSLERKA